MSPTEAKEKVEKLLPQVLHDAFAKYLHTFGVEPHGTLPQMAALSELGIISSVAALLTTTHQEGEDKGKESAALTVESFGCDHLTCERDWCDDREKTLAEEIRKTKSGEGRG